MHARLLTAVLLARTTLAFRDTYPVVGWSSHASAALDSVASTFAGLPSIDDVFNHLFSDDSICSHDAVLLIDSPGLHASDLRTLSSSSPLTVSLGSAQSAVQLPYAKRSSVEGLTSAAEQLAKRCGGRVTQLGQDVNPANLAQQGGKHVMCMNMPELSGAAAERKDAVAQHAAHMMGELERVAAALPKHLILLAGGPSSPSLFAREMPAPGATFESTVSHAIFPAVTPAANDTLVHGGILARYQLLTPGLILGLLVSFFVLVPVLFAGISALNSIQAPVNMVAPKGYSADTKKNQ